jgi:ParB family transcriptional regulator, chromosome partitioning protein
VKDAMIDGTIDMGHARALLPLQQEQQVQLARKVARFGWSVRKVERTVKALLAEPASRSTVKPPLDLQTRWLERQLARELGEKISIRPGANGDYVLQLGFADLAKLESSLQRLRELVRQIREVAGPRARENAS